MSERLKVRVLLLIGGHAELVTPHRGVEEPERVPVAQIVADTGIPAEELPGRELVAVVEGGELVRFERP
jgi:hypothetical protein